MSKIIGIDLGTTNSCVSVIEGGEPTVIVNSEGTRTTPSVVSFDKGEIKVGASAKRVSVTNPTNTIYSVKRFMGQRFSELNSHHLNVPYDVSKDSSNGININVDGKSYIPQEISAMVLQNIKKSAEEYLGDSVSKAVITVPAYFNDSQRQATKEAGEIAGLEVLRIVNEPTAAALSYGLDKSDKDMRIAVFDLGGGTFDISILELGDGVFEVLSTNGDTQLGGDDFDDVIVSWILDEIESESGVDVSKDPMALQRIRESAEKSKVELSSTSTTSINLPYISVGSSGPIHFDKSLSRAEFERLSSKLVERCLIPCRNAVGDSGINISDIDEVILVGGSTRIPMVQKLVEDYFKRTPNKSVNPDEVVSIGASIQAGVLAGDVTDVLLLDVTPLSLGIETMGGVFTPIIESNTTIPVKKSQTFSTVENNQRVLDIHVLQGERPMVRDNRTLGKFKLGGIPLAPKGVPQIEVTFDIDANGIINVSAKDLGTQQEQKIRIESGTGLSDDEIERMKRDAELNRESDQRKREEVESVNKATSYLFESDKQLNELSDKLSEDDRTRVSKLSDQLRESINHNQTEQIIDLHSKLELVWNDITSKMYNNTETEDISHEEI